MKRLVVGDIHGCWDELQHLLDVAALGADDEILSLGDFVDRGPGSLQVVEFLRTRPNSRALAGNHERKHVASFQGRGKAAPSQMIVRHQIGEERYPSVCAFFETLPLLIELEEALLVHGFIEPGVPLPEQRDSVLAGGMSGEAHLERTYERPWYELYEGDKPVIVGHLDYLATGEPLVYRDLIYGLDTGCCRGKRLTGLLLPEFRIVSVPSRMDYWQDQLDEHRRVVVSVSLALVRDDKVKFGEIPDVLSLVEDDAALASEDRERLDALASLLARGEQALALIDEHIRTRAGAILSELEQMHEYSKLDEKRRGQLFAVAVGKSPVGPQMHKVRTGTYSLEDLRKCLDRPAKAIALAQELGLTGGGTEGCADG